MKPAFSTYLDVLRFTAAMAVVAGHFSFIQFMEHSPFPESMASAAVAVFFVLSGYVISYVAHEKETTLREYTVSRLARLYSVALPALILTLSIDTFLIHRGSNVFVQLPLYEYHHLWKYLPLFLVFASEVGGFHAQVFGDGPFWSLSYEAWYYVTFAMFFYVRGPWRWLLGIGTTLFLGPQALLYFPIWLLGGALYSIHSRTSINPVIATIGAVFSGALFIGLQFTNVYGFLDGLANTALHGWPQTHLHNSANFVSFYLAAVIAAMNIFFVRYCRLSLLSAGRTRRAIVYLASFTFAVYLSHRPLMNLWATLINHNPKSTASVLFLALLVLSSCWCFGLISEQLKGRWRAMFDYSVTFFHHSGLKLDGR